MRPAAFRPAAQVFVCTNVRAADDPLRSGCGEAGPAVFGALKREALARGVATKVWIVSTGCQGQCSREGCAVVIHPPGEHLVAVREADVAGVFLRAASARARSE